MIESIQTAGKLQVNSGDSAWMLTSSALVMLMVLGVAFFYAGVVRKKNVLGTIVQSFTILCVVSVVWVLWGYTLSFGKDINGVIGGFDFLGLRGVGQDCSSVGGATIPQYVYVMFQGMFAAVTVALITGAFAERMKFSALLVFTVCWHTLVYCPVVHWTWGGGWIGEILGAIDFAGGTVVHISAGAAAIAAAMVVGKRTGYGVNAMVPHNLTMSVFGMALIWFGWFGFNAGSALKAGGAASVALVTTNTAASAGALCWMFIEWYQTKRPTALGICSGALAGLVAITPAAGYVTVIASLIIGIAASALCYVAVMLKTRLNYDDSLDVIGIHAVGGVWGTLATGAFASTAVNPLAINGMFYGNPPFFAIQSVAVVSVFLFVLVSTAIILKLIDLLMGLRVKEEDELLGLDKSVHGESGYIMR